jgi:tRNA A-37 threonylcarbamoyl transferase component Bud32
MHPERWKTVERIFHAALERGPQERAAFLDSACPNDPELRSEVESLLKETSQTASFIEPPLVRQSLTGCELNHYRIGPLLGQGGMAEVYRAHDTRLHRDVALKVLHSADLLDRERLERFYREAQVLAAVNHPNIASVYGFEEANGICALVLELVEGETLSERIARQPEMPVAAILDIASQIASALDAPHSKGIIHRDLKPSNIKITPGGMVKVLDFGIAKLLQSSDEETDRRTTISRQNVVLGTVAYMSPEQARGWAIDTRTDIWAFGCVLYEMLAGIPAFQGETPTDIVVKIASEEPDWRRLSGGGGTTSLTLQRIARKCLQKASTSRYQSVRELAVDLDALRPLAVRPHESSAISAQPPVQFVMPGKAARPLFLLTQCGYLALYTAAMFYIDSIGEILSTDFLVPGQIGVVATIILAVCGIAVRVYLISAVGWGHPAAGDKFHKLFPALLILDGFWSASPLLLWRHIGYGIAFTCIAMLAYVPFAQRTMIRSLYPNTPVHGFSRFFETN